MTKFTLGEYRTRDGQPARVVFADRPGDFPLVGIYGETFQVSTWRQDGSFGVRAEHRLDLVLLGSDAVVNAEATPEWGEPIPTPGGSCPEWLTLDLIRGNQFSYGSDEWKTLPTDSTNQPVNWHWGLIHGVRFPVGHPIYAQRQLEAAGYTVTPPAPPEPDYEAYREKLIEFYSAKRLGAAVTRLRFRSVECMSNNDRRNIEALIAVGVTP